MALTIKKKTAFINEGNFDLTSIIKDCIKSLLLNRLSLRKINMLRYVEYFLAYKTCEHTNEKTLSSIFLKRKYEKKYIRIAAKEIELSGATIIEFIDYLDEYNAKEITSSQSLLEIV